MDYVFQEFGGYAGEGDGSVVFCCLLAAFLVDGDNVCLLPVGGDDAGID